MRHFCCSAASLLDAKTHRQRARSNIVCVPLTSLCRPSCCRSRRCAACLTTLQQTTTSEKRQPFTSRQLAVSSAPHLVRARPSSNTLSGRFFSVSARLAQLAARFVANLDVAGSIPGGLTHFCTFRFERPARTRGLCALPGSFTRVGNNLNLA